MMEKKVIMVIKNLETKMFSPYFLAFLLIKRKKNYKANFSTNLILKKKPTKIILKGKKPMKKNVVEIDNVL